MFVPTFDNGVSVLVNHSFDLAEIIRFDALLLGKNKHHAQSLLIVIKLLVRYHICQFLDSWV